jgi:hypothetical protein
MLAHLVRPKPVGSCNTLAMPNLICEFRSLGRKLNC